VTTNELPAIVETRAERLVLARRDIEHTGDLV
jgi:hypothetical protein